MQDVDQSVNYFLVCGLGNLGQYCISVLKEFGVAVNGIEIVDSPKWQIPDLPTKLDKLVIGDCRQPTVLEQAGIRYCRAILIFIGILYAIMTERVLSAKFQFSRRRALIPKSDHVVLVGLGRIGQRVATILQELKQPLVAVHATTS